MTAPASVSLQDLMYAYYKAAVPAANLNLAVTLGQGIVTSGGGGGATNATIVNPVDGSGNVKVAVQGTVPVSGNVGITGTPSVNSTIVGPVDGSGNLKVSNQVSTQDSVVGGGTTTATPTGGTSIVSAPVATAGVYEITFAGGFGATAESTQLDNIGVKINGTFVTVIPLQNNANYMSQPYTIRKNLAAGDTVTVYVLNNGSAGSIYKGYFCATRIS